MAFSENTAKADRFGVSSLELRVYRSSKPSKLSKNIPQPQFPHLMHGFPNNFFAHFGLAFSALGGKR